MAEVSVFDVLSSRLSGDERRDLLLRIKTSASLSSEPLFGPDSIPVARPPESGKPGSSLGLVARIILFFRRFFSGKSIEDLLLEDELRNLGQAIAARHPGLIDLRHGLLLDGFAEQLLSLRDAARFFKDVLARSVDNDKGAFLAFLVSVELPDIDERFSRETDPFARAEAGVPASEMRAAVLQSWEEILRSLTDEKRRVMYGDLRSLLFLRRLSGFLFDRLTGLFRPHATGVIAASIEEARPLILELGDLLFSLSIPPSPELLEAFFFVAARDELGRTDYDAEEAIAAELAAGAAALQRIRSFNARVPLGEILRYVSGDPDYLPRELPGGEDWLALLKTFWKERIEARLEEFKLENHSRELAAEIADFIGEAQLATYPNLTRAGTPETPPMRFELALTLLEGFWQGPFLHELNRPLKILLVDGDFYRKDNRIEFTDAYNELLRIHERLGALDLRVSSSGEIGEAWRQANNEMLALPLKRRKLDAIRRGAEDEAEKLIRGAGEAFGKMAVIVRGILKGEAGGRYDSLQNLSTIDGRANREFIRSLEQLRSRCERAKSLLGELSGLDLGKIE